MDFGGSVFYPTFSNVQDYYFWEEEKKYKDTFILDYFLNKSARKDTGESLPDNALKNAPENDTDNAQGNERKVARHGKPVGSRFAAWDKSWEIAQKTARLTERENARKNTPSDDEILTLSDVPTGNPPFDPTGVPTGGRRNFRGNAR